MAGQRYRPVVLPRGWTGTIRSAVLQTISLGHYAITQARGKAALSCNPRLRRRARFERSSAEKSMLHEVLRITGARMTRVPAHRRPRYTPCERLAILELRAALSWSLAETAQHFQVTPATISSWQRHIDEEGPDALVKLPQPVNKFPDLVYYLTQRLKTLCPALGKRKIAESLARAGLHLSATTVGRILKQKPRPRPFLPISPEQTSSTIVAKRPNHTWHVDLTAVPITSGFWVPWLPFSLPQRWPFCSWAAVVIDHYSRRAMGTATFYKQPTSEQVRAFLGRTITKNRASPKYLICDRGVQFDCRGLRKWCRRRGIQVRYGAVGRHGSIAVVERFIRTLKESLRQLTLMPLRKESLQRELSLIVDWYNDARPHSGLGGKTPSEVYYKKFPANRRPCSRRRSMVRYTATPPHANPLRRAEVSPPQPGRDGHVDDQTPARRLHPRPHLPLPVSRSPLNGNNTQRHDSVMRRSFLLSRSDPFVFPDPFSSLILFNNHDSTRSKSHPPPRKTA